MTTRRFLVISVSVSELSSRGEAMLLQIQSSKTREKHGDSSGKNDTAVHPGDAGRKLEQLWPRESVNLGF